MEAFIATYSALWLLNETIKRCFVSGAMFGCPIHCNVEQDRGVGVWRGHQILEE